MPTLSDYIEILRGIAELPPEVLKQGVVVMEGTYGEVISRRVQFHKARVRAGEKKLLPEDKLRVIEMLSFLVRHKETDATTPKLAREAGSTSEWWVLKVKDFLLFQSLAPELQEALAQASYTRAKEAEVPEPIPTNSIRNAGLIQTMKADAYMWLRQYDGDKARVRAELAKFPSATEELVDQVMKELK